MNKKTLFFILVLALSVVNLGTVRRTEDPIRDTQTNGILYKQKMEEEKDGKKGPLLYHVKNSPREKFFIEPPFEKEKTPSPGELGGEKATSPLDATGWWEEQPASSQTVPASGTVSEPLPETAPAVEAGQEPEAAEQSLSEPKTESGTSDKGSDYWW